MICAEAGLTVDAAFGRVARELGKAYPELGDEFALTSIELGFLTDRRSAFENLAKRIDLEAVRGVVTTMIQTEKYGTPLASALRVLSAEFRNERMMRAEEKAARLPAIMTVPLILFILPVLFIVILGPAACSINDALLSCLGSGAGARPRCRSVRPRNNPRRRFARIDAGPAMLDGGIAYGSLLARPVAGAAAGVPARPVPRHGLPRQPEMEAALSRGSSARAEEAAKREKRSFAAEREMESLHHAAARARGTGRRRRRPRPRQL